MGNTVLFVTGARGSGKSSACTSAAGILKARGYPCSGILCSSLRTAEGRPYSILARDLLGGSTRLLAERPAEGLSGFAFSQEGFAWANGILREAAEGWSFPLFLDEVGPLELQSGGGYMPFLSWLASRRSGALAIVVRRELLDALTGFFGSSMPGLWKMDSIAVDENSRDRAAGMIADSLCHVVDPPIFIYSEAGEKP
jgi:nucleoside-triphosphatase THEP1